MSTDTPREAKSIDELCVGQLVAIPLIGEVVAGPLVGIDGERIKVCDDGTNYAYEFPEHSFVILRDVPPEPVKVPRDAFNLLAARLDDYDGISTCRPVLAAAEALVKAARGSER